MLQGSLVAWWTPSPRASTRLGLGVPVDSETAQAQGLEHSSRDPDSLPFLCPPSQLDEGPMGEPEGSFVDYQTTMVRTAKAIAVTVQEMVSWEIPGELPWKSWMWTELHFFYYR